jgi:hypothetical protein
MNMVKKESSKKFLLKKSVQFLNYPQNDHSNHITPYYLILNIYVKSVHQL